MKHIPVIKESDISAELEHRLSLNISKNIFWQSNTHPYFPKYINIECITFQNILIIGLNAWIWGIIWTWLWASSRRWWRTGKPGVLQSMGSQRVGHNWETEFHAKSLELGTSSSAHTFFLCYLLSVSCVLNCAKISSSKTSMCKEIL